MGTDELSSVEMPTSYGDTGTAEPFSLPISPKPYFPPDHLAVTNQDGTLNLELTQDNIKDFVDKMTSAIADGKTDEAQLAKTFFSDLQITTANWHDFGKKFPELKRPIEEVAFKIATLILAHQGADDSQVMFVAARFLATIVIYKNHGINRGQLYKASRLPAFFVPIAGTSSGRVLYEKLLESLRYAIDKRDDDPQAGQGRGGYFDVEANSSIIKASAGADKVVGENSEASLDGRDSYSSAGTIQSYRWEQISGPKVSWVSAIHVATPHFKTPTVFKDEKLVFKLSVTDSIGDPYEDTVVYTVTNDINEPPHVEIRGPKEVLAGHKVALTAIGKDDNEDTISFSWQETTRHGIHIHPQSSTEPNQSRVAFTAPLITGRPQNVTLRVVVDDGHGAEKNGRAVKECTVKVLPLPQAPAPAPLVAEVKPETVEKPAPAPILIPKPVVVPAKPKTSPMAKTPPKSQTTTPPKPKEITVSKSPVAQADPPLPPLPFTTTRADAPAPNTVVTTISNLHPLDPEKPNNRILILIDVSGSMVLSAGDLVMNADAIVNMALERTADGSFLEMALGYYYDGKTEITMPFTRVEKQTTSPDTESEAYLKERFRTKTSDIANQIANGTRETLWYSVYEVISGSKRLDWEDSAANTYEAIIALTDTEAMVLPNAVGGMNREAAFALAERKGIDLKPVILSDPAGIDVQQFINNKLATYIATLADRNATVMQKAVAAQNLKMLGREQLQDLVPHLVILYDHYGNDDDVVRIAILQAIKPGGKEVNDFLQRIADDKENSSAVRQMAKAKLIDAEHLEESLAVAAVILDKEGIDAAASLIEMSRKNDSPTELRQVAMDALEAYEPSPEIAQFMLDVVHNNTSEYDTQIRLTAMRYLQKNNFPAGETVYAAILNNRSESEIVRLQTTKLLAKIDTPQAAWTLNQVMLDRNNPMNIRQAASLALKELEKTSRSAQIYLAVLNKENPIFDADAKEVELSPFMKVVEDKSMAMPLRSDMIDILQTVGGPKAMEALLKEMRDPNNAINVRQKSARALRAFNQPEVVSQLVIVFGKKGGDPYLRKAAGESLAHLASPEAIEPAMQILKEERCPEVIPVAIQIVAQSNDPRTLAIIKKVQRQYKGNQSIHEAAEKELAR